MRAGKVRPAYETNEGGGKFPEKGNLRGISVVLAEMRLHGQKKFQKK